MKFLSGLKGFLLVVWQGVKDLRKLNRKTIAILLIATIIALFFILMGMLFFVGHQSKKMAAEAAKPVIADVRGYIYHGPEVNAFRPCEGESEYLVTSDPDINLWKIYSDLAPEDYLPVYVEMKVQFLKNEEGVVRSDYVGQVLVKELYHLAYESLGCELDKSYNFLLHGNEPSWKIIIDEKRGVFLQEAGQEEVYATYASPTKIDNGLVYNLISGNSPMNIKIRKIDTYDSMSGAYYAYSAFVAFNGKTYDGQALVGRPLF